MNERIKMPKGIKSIAGLMFAIGLIMMLLQIGFFMGVVPFEGSDGFMTAVSASAIAEIIFIAPLFILAGVGLWKIKEWGLFTALIAFGARISIDIIWTPMDIMFVGAGAVMASAITYSVIWHTITICMMTFAIISIVYLWRNRRCFS